MPAVESLVGVRVVASPVALDTASWPVGAQVVRTAPDEALVLGTDDPQVALDDPEALVEVETGVCGVRLDRAGLDDWLEREAEWAAPPAGTAQGSAAGLPVTVWVEGDTALVMTRASLAQELEERL